MKNKIKTSGILLVTGLLLLLTLSSAYAAIPYTINYQGYLTDSGENPITGTRSMVFKIYNAVGTLLWTETQNSVSVNNGIYNVILGSVNTLSSLPFDVPYFLGVTIGTDDEMFPRQPLTSVGYAFSADAAFDLVCSGCVSAIDADTTAIQRRVTGTCTAGSSIRVINQDGTVTCETDDGITVETDPQVGAVTASKWCTGDGTAVQCSQNTPILSETDPQVGTLTASLWCASNAGATAIDCNQPAPALSGWTDDGAVVRLTTSTDNVGIGLTTPNRKLYVVENMSGMSYPLKIDNPHSTFNTDASGILFSVGGGGGNNLTTTRGKGALVYRLTDTWNRGSFHFLQEPSENEANPTLANAVMTVRNDGNVGIGTIAPNAKLDVAGKINITTSGWTSPHLHLELSSNTAYNSSILQAADGLLFRNFSQPPNNSYPLFSFRDNADTRLLEIYPDGYTFVKGLIDLGGSRFDGDATFWGHVDIQGSLSKPFGSFKIDHPLDPEHKYLYHSFVESPDMKNIYDGIIILNEYGEAWVELPEWFEALNKDFRYQLTCIGSFAPVYVESEISSNRFKIAGGKEGLKVSWQVTGIRHDPVAETNRIQVEKKKSDSERGLYLYPEAYGLPKEKGIHRER